MKYKIFISVCLIILIGNIIFFFLNEIHRLKDSNKLLIDKNIIFEETIRKFFIFKNNKLNIEEIQNYSDTLYNSLMDRLEKKNTIVWFIPEEYCKDCIINIQTSLNKQPLAFKEKIILLSEFKKIRDIKMFINTYKIKYPVYNSNKISSGVKDFNLSMSLFVLDSLLIPKHLFFPISHFPELNEEYYAFLAKSESFNKDYTKYQYIDNERIAFDKKIHDFGKVYLSNNISTNFIISNNSTEPFVIHDIRTSCGCTATSWSKEYKDGIERIMIKVNFTAEEIGIFKKNIVVFSNASNSPHTLAITGYVTK